MKQSYEARYGHSRRSGAGSYQRAMKARRRQEGEARNKSWASLSVETQLEQLSHRPGMCAKQIARLSHG